MSSDTIQMLMMALVVALYIPACFVIARKAGYPGWYSLLMLVPVLNLALIYCFALARWPLEQGLAGDDGESTESVEDCRPIGNQE